MYQYLCFVYEHDFSNGNIIPSYKGVLKTFSLEIAGEKKEFGSWAGETGPTPLFLLLNPGNSK